MSNEQEKLIETNRACNRCGSDVFESEIREEYSYQCMKCDEDLYAYETHEK